jgi:hypothetical protein
VSRVDAIADLRGRVQVGALTSEREVRHALEQMGYRKP